MPATRRPGEVVHGTGRLPEMYPGSSKKRREEREPPEGFELLKRTAENDEGAQPLQRPRARHPRKPKEGASDIGVSARSGVVKTVAVVVVTN